MFKTNELPCTEACWCMGDDECKNPHKGQIDDDVSKDEGEFQ